MMEKMDKNDTILWRLRELEENSKCADCTDSFPRYMNTTYGTFVCSVCGAIHRELGNRVKSITSDKFTEEDIERLQKVGNKMASEIWLSNWNANQCPIPYPSDEKKVREFIKMKYIDKKWIKDSANLNDMVSTTKPTPGSTPSFTSPSIGSSNANNTASSASSAAVTSPPRNSGENKEVLHSKGSLSREFETLSLGNTSNLLQQHQQHILNSSGNSIQQSSTSQNNNNNNNNNYNINNSNNNSNNSYNSASTSANGSHASVPQYDQNGKPFNPFRGENEYFNSKPQNEKKESFPPFSDKPFDQHTYLNEQKGTGSNNSSNNSSFYSKIQLQSATPKPPPTSIYDTPPYQQQKQQQQQQQQQQQNQMNNSINGININNNNNNYNNNSNSNNFNNYNNQMNNSMNGMNNMNSQMFNNPQQQYNPFLDSSQQQQPIMNNNQLMLLNQQSIDNNNQLALQQMPQQQQQQQQPIMNYNQNQQQNMYQPQPQQNIPQQQSQSQPFINDQVILQHQQMHQQNMQQQYQQQQQQMVNSNGQLVMLQAPSTTTTTTITHQPLGNPFDSQPPLDEMFGKKINSDPVFPASRNSTSFESGNNLDRADEDQKQAWRDIQEKNIQIQNDREIAKKLQREEEDIAKHNTDVETRKQHQKQQQLYQQQQQQLYQQQQQQTRPRSNTEPSRRPQQYSTYQDSYANPPPMPLSSYNSSSRSGGFLRKLSGRSRSKSYDYDDPFEIPPQRSNYNPNEYDDYDSFMRKNKRIPGGGETYQPKFNHHHQQQQQQQNYQEPPQQQHYNNNQQIVVRNESNSSSKSFNECDYCGKQVGLELMSYHKNTECILRQERCNYCNKLVKHIQMDEHQMDCQNKTYTCGICGRLVIGREMPSHMSHIHNQ